VLKVQFVKGEITRKEVVWFYSVEEEEKRRGGDWVYFSVFVNLFVEYLHLVPLCGYCFEEIILDMGGA
jgi:hypothetical protein